MRSSLRILLVAAVLLAGGCATPPQSTQPDWVNGDSATYKPAQYLLGKGQGPSQDDARDRARADLAKIFRVAVVARSEDVQKFQTTPAGGQYEAKTSRSISTRTDQIVSGIQIAELWQDPETKVYHALAILPRLQTATTLRQQIGQLDDATSRYIDRSRAADDLFLKIAAAYKALEMQRERSALQKSLQVVDITGRGVAPRWNAATLEADLGALLRRVRIASSVTPDSAPGAADIVGGALAKAGFMLDTGKHPDFQLKTRLHLDEPLHRDGWYWQRGTIQATLIQTASGSVRGTKRWDIKASATDRDEAVRRALSQANALLQKELGPAIMSMATSGEAPNARHRR